MPRASKKAHKQGYKAALKAQGHQIRKKMRREAKKMLGPNHPEAKDIPLQKSKEYKQAALIRRYGPGSDQHFYKERKQDRRWIKALIERRDRDRPKDPNDRDTFFRQTRARPHQEVEDPLLENAEALEKTSGAVAALFKRLARERAEAIKERPPHNGVDLVEDWWGKGPFMWGPFKEPVGEYTKKELAAIHQRFQPYESNEEGEMEEDEEVDMELETEGEDEEEWIKQVERDDEGDMEGEVAEDVEVDMELETEVDDEEERVMQAESNDERVVAIYSDEEGVIYIDSDVEDVIESESDEQGEMEIDEGGDIEDWTDGEDDDERVTEEEDEESMEVESEEEGEEGGVSIGGRRKATEMKKGYGGDKTPGHRLRVS